MRLFDWFLEQWEFPNDPPRDRIGDPSPPHARHDEEHWDLIDPPKYEWPLKIDEKKT